MKVFCPNCGTENEGTPDSRVTCRACTASFEVPNESGQAPSPQPPQQQQPSFGGRPVQSLDRATPQPPVVVQPPPQVWTSNAPGASFAPPSASGQNNTLAIISVVSSFLGCFCAPVIGSLTGIITGFIALSQINASNGGQKGRELAIGGIAVGFLGCFLGLAWVVFRAAVSR